MLYTYGTLELTSRQACRVRVCCGVGRWLYHTNESHHSSPPCTFHSSHSKSRVEKRRANDIDCGNRPCNRQMTYEQSNQYTTNEELSFDDDSRRAKRKPAHAPHERRIGGKARDTSTITRPRDESGRLYLERSSVLVHAVAARVVAHEETRRLGCRPTEGQSQRLVHP